VAVLTTFLITSVTPRGGGPTVSVTVAGSGFGLPAGSVIFDPLGIALAATVTGWTTTQIDFDVPAGVLENRFATLYLQRFDGADGASVPFWVPPADPQTNGGLDFQYPAFEAGDDQDTDDPTTQTAADFNRVIDRLLAVEAAVGGSTDVMRKSVYDIADNGQCDVADAIDDGGGGSKTWADIVALVGAATAPVVTRPYQAGVTLRDAVYQRSDGRADKTDASDYLKVELFLGFVSALDVPSAGLCTIQYGGDLAGFAGLTVGRVYILSTTPGGVVDITDTGNLAYPNTTPGSGHAQLEVGLAGTATTLFIEPGREPEAFI